MDPNEEPGPSTSKHDEKGSHKTNSNTDVEKQDERGSSESYMSTTHSENSRVEMGHERSKHPAGVKKERKQKARKSRGRPAGRVVKKSRHPDLKARRRRSKRIRDRRKREVSISTIYTRLSSSLSVRQGCPHCGHRCCRRRYYETKRKRMRRPRNFCTKEELHHACMGTQTTGSECIQVGSRCLMLSPLCLNTNATPPALVPEEQRACEITPEMIHEALRRLTMWRHDVNTEAILDYIKRNYPVGLSEQLLAELTEKLRIAAIVGIVTQISEDKWCLSCALQQRKLTQNHVTLFWKVYGDTMKPVTRKPDDASQETGQDQQSNTVQDRVIDIDNAMYDYI